MATWKKIVLAKGTSSQYIKGDGSFATYSDGVGLGDNNTWTGINTFSGALNPYIYINDTNGAKGIFQAYDTYVNIGSDSNHETRIVQNNATAITIDTSKNATFAGELDVNPATNKRIKFTFPTDEYANESRIGFSDLNAHITYKAQNNFMEMWSYNSLFLQTGSSATTALTLDSSQNATFAGSGTFGGQVKVTSSNASTVALSVGDAGTGWYNTGTNSIGLSINGTQKFNVDNAGNATFTQGVDGDAYIALDNVAGAGSSVNETAALRLNLGDGSTIRGGAKITAKKEADFSTGANMDSSLTLSVLQNNAFNDALIISSAGNVEVNTGALKIKTAGQELQWVNGATKLTGADTYLEFNVNSARRFKLDANSVISLSNNDSGTSNTVFGKLAGAALASGGNYNVLVGEDAGNDLTTGERNVVVGFGALDRGTTESDDNVAIGWEALHGNHTTAAVNDCVAVGSQAIGTGTLTAAASGSVGIGHNALKALTSGAENVAIGYQASLLLGTGDGNTVIGHQAFKAADGAEGSNVVIGKTAGQSINNDASVQNVIIGVGAMSGGTAQQDKNVALGYFAMGSIGNNAQTGTVAVGSNALAALTSGAGNLAVGYQAMSTHTTGTNNIAIGHGAMDDTDAGSTSLDSDENVFVGVNAGGGTWVNSKSRFNVGIGNNSFAAAMNGVLSNTAVGYNSLNKITEGDENIAMGSQAGEEITTGDYNICLGTGAGKTTLSTGNDNIIIGRASDTSASGGSNQIIIGKGVTGVANNSVTLGNSAVTDVYMAQDSGATVHCGAINASSIVKIDQNATDAFSLHIDSEATTTHNLYFEGPVTTTGAVIRVDSASALTTGWLFNANISSTAMATTATDGAFKIDHTGNTGSNVNNLMYLHNNHESSTGTIPLKIQQDSTGPALHLITSDNQGDGLIMEMSGTSSGGSFITFQYDENASAPSETNDMHGGIRFRSAYSDNTYSGYGASITSISEGGPPTSGQSPGALIFSTTPTSSTTLVERMRIGNDGRVYTADGISHLGDADTRMYMGDDDIQFLVGNVAMVRMLENGSQDEVIINEDQADVDFRVESDGNAHALFVQASTGNIGIGGTPDTLLHLYSSSASKPILKIENEQGGANPVSIQMLRNTSSPADDDFIGQIDFRSMNDAGTPEEILYAYISAQSTDITDGSEDGEMNFHTMKAGALTNTMTLQSGLVGIGTASPSSWNALAHNLVVYENSNSGITIGSSTTGTGSLYFGDGTGGDAAYKGSVEYNHSSNVLQFRANSVLHMTLDASGNVGIGESTPLGKLHVYTGDSTHTGAVDSGANEFVIEGSGDTGMSILSPAGNKGGIYFSRAGANTAGSINYHHVNDSPSNSMVFSTASTTAVTIDANQDTTFAGDITTSESLTVAKAYPHMINASCDFKGEDDEHYVGFKMSSATTATVATTSDLFNGYTWVAPFNTTLRSIYVTSETAVTSCQLKVEVASTYSVYVNNTATTTTTYTKSFTTGATANVSCGLSISKGNAIRFKINPPSNVDQFLLTFVFE